jgi:hypothetical protein
VVEFGHLVRPSAAHSFSLLLRMLANESTRNEDPVMCLYDSTRLFGTDVPITF